MAKTKKKRETITVKVNELYIGDYQSFKVNTTELKIAEKDVKE
ncbi:MAG: hypothetical protein ABSF65_02005 [Candidatus Bathyarchaeia archaeon]|jgi:hypothetical protein